VVLTGPDGRVLGYKEALNQGLAVPEVEDSFFVPKPREMAYPKFEGLVLSLLGRYQQPAALVQNEKGAHILFQNGSREIIGPEFTPENLSQGYSHLRKRPRSPFVFEGVAHPANNIARMAFQAMGLRWFVDKSEVFSPCLVD